MGLTRRTFLRSSVAMLAATACSPTAAPVSKPAETKPATPPTSAPPAAQPTVAAQPTAVAPPAASAAQTPAAAAAPRTGGELQFIVGAEPPSFDGHRETTFALLHALSPHYSLLIRFNPDAYPEVMPDLAESWDVSADKLTYTFKIRDGVKFHDGSPCTARDIKASYDRILNPPEGVVSARKGSYGAVESVEAPDPGTIVFKLKYPSAALLTLLASPFNYIYSADKLAADQKFPEKNVLGTGPYKFVEYVPGSHWVGQKNPDYFVQGRPYLDGFRANFIREPAAQIAAIRGGRAQIEFRGFPPPARDDLVRAMGDKIKVEESAWIVTLIAIFNTEKAPFNDPRVRRALNIAVDRWEGSNALSRITVVKPVGTFVRPGSPFHRPESELLKMEGFSRDMTQAREEARRLLREAGVPDGFAFNLKNRDVPTPYEPSGVFLIDQWRRIGLNVTHVQQESNAYLSDHRAGNFEVSVDFIADYADEPDIQLSKFLSPDRSASNYSRYTDRELDALYDQQSRETDPERRNQLVWQFEDRCIQQMAYAFPIIWWQRIVPYSSSVKNYPVLPSHYVNQDLAHVWLDA